MYLNGSVPQCIPAALSLENVCLPDFSGNGLFNLAVSLARACGAPVREGAPELNLSDGRVASQAWANHEILIFLLVDGLGDHFLSANRNLAPNLWRDRVERISSVFPSTTATAITTVMTGESAAVHGMLGWFVYDEPSARIVAPLPMRLRGSHEAPSSEVIGRLLRTPPMVRHATRRATHFVTLPALAQGPFSLYHSAGADTCTYDEIEGMADAIAQALNGARGPQYVYAYTPLLDRTAHDFGIDSVAARAVLARVDATYVRIRERLPHAQIVVAADHGFIDNPPGHQIDLMQHPDIHAMLRAPLSGEQRTAYCHVRSEYAEIFGRVIHERFGHALVALTAAQALSAGLFGPGPVARDTVARCGDWILLAQGDWTVRDSVAGETPHPMVGVHGGLSQAEMQVPLILAM